MYLKEIVVSLIKQKRLPLVGAVKITYTHTAVYINLVTFLLTTAIFWRTTGQYWSMHHFGYAPPYWLFLIGVMGTIALFGTFLVYRFDVPSTLGWYFDQLYEHGTTLKQDIRRIESKLDNMKSDKQQHRREIRRNRR